MALQYSTIEAWLSPWSFGTSTYSIRYFGHDQHGASIGTLTSTTSGTLPSTTSGTKHVATSHSILNEEQQRKGLLSFDTKATMALRYEHVIDSLQCFDQHGKHHVREQSSMSSPWRTELRNVGTCPSILNEARIPLQTTLRIGGTSRILTLPV